METIIDFDNEIQEIISNLKQVKGYLDCEKIIIHHIGCNFIFEKTGKPLKIYIESHQINKTLNRK